MVDYASAAATLLNKNGADRCTLTNDAKSSCLALSICNVHKKKKKDFVYSVECTIFVLTFSGKESIMENIITTEKNKICIPPIGDTK